MSPPVSLKTRADILSPTHPWPAEDKSPAIFEKCFAALAKNFREDNFTQVPESWVNPTRYFYVVNRMDKDGRADPQGAQACSGMKEALRKRGILDDYASSQITLLAFHRYLNQQDWNLLALLNNDWKLSQTEQVLDMKRRKEKFFIILDRIVGSKKMQKDEELFGKGFESKPFPEGGCYEVKTLDPIFARITLESFPKDDSKVEMLSLDLAADVQISREEIAHKYRDHPKRSQAGTEGHDSWIFELDKKTSLTAIFYPDKKRIQSIVVNHSL